MAIVRFNTISANLEGSGKRHSQRGWESTIHHDLSAALRKLETVSPDLLQTQLEEVKKQASKHKLSWDRAGTLAGQILRKRTAGRQQISELLKSLASSNDFYSGAFQALGAGTRSGFYSDSDPAKGVSRQLREGPGEDTQREKSEPNL